MSHLSVSALPGRSAAVFAATCLLSMAGSAAPVAGQLEDRGSFRILADGAEIGTEQFTIERRGTGDAQITIASSRITMRDGRDIATLLRLVGPGLVLSEYAASEIGADTTSVQLVRLGDQLRARSETKWGERVRTYTARPGTCVLDGGVAHHYFVLGRFAAGESVRRTVHAFSRAGDGLESVNVLDARQESIELGGERMEATRIDFSDGDGTGTVWFDGSGRLMRVARPGGGLVFERVS